MGHGTFQTMNLNSKLIRNLKHNMPTPVQRKSIPLILEGKDVAIAARTGSGKTIAFLLPVIHHLLEKERWYGIVVSPTRELSIQTYRCARELLQGTGLRARMITGGIINKHSDREDGRLIIGTVGALLHTELPLNSMHYVVLDEADAMFEQNMRDQLRELMAKFHPERQTCLFSATLPPDLAEFAEAELHDPSFIRLDTETRLNDGLRLEFVVVSSERREALVLELLERHPALSRKVLFFVPTRYHAECFEELLRGKINAAAVHGQLDQQARNKNLMAFRNNQIRVLIVTDVAARGLDIPLIESVLNFDPPSDPRLFVHRVGRVARAGRSGLAVTLMLPSEFPCIEDFSAYCGRNVSDSIYTVPQKILDSAEARKTELYVLNGTLQGLALKSARAYKKYQRTRPRSSCKTTTLKREQWPVLSLYEKEAERVSEASSILQALKNYRPCGEKKHIDKNTIRSTPALRNEPFAIPKDEHFYKESKKEKRKQEYEDTKRRKEARERRSRN